MSLLSHSFVYKTRMKRVIGYRKKTRPCLNKTILQTEIIELKIEVKKIKYTQIMISFYVNVGI